MVRRLLSALSLVALLGQILLAPCLVRCEHPGPDGRVVSQIDFWECCGDCCGKHGSQIRTGEPTLIGEHQEQGNPHRGCASCVDTKVTPPECARAAPQALPVFAAVWVAVSPEAIAFPPVSVFSCRPPPSLHGPPLFLTQRALRI